MPQSTTTRLTMLVLAIGLGASAQAPPASIEKTYTIRAWQTLDPIPLELRLGQQVRVLPRESPTGIPAISVMVLDGDKNLQDRDDALQDAKDFTWSPGRDGGFYLTVRNLSEIEGQFSVFIEPVVLQSRGEEKDWATEEVFYATNRETAGSVRQNADCGSSQAPRYGPGLGSELSLGVSYVSLRRSNRRMGELEAFNVLRIFVNKAPTEQTVVISCVNPSNETDFYGRIGTRVKSSREKRVLVFIHGYRNTFEDALLRAAQIAYDLRVDGPPILFSWPSQGTLEGYPLDRNNADASYALLASFLQRVAKETGAAQIDVIAHSMGNWVLSNALRDISTRMKANPSVTKALPLFRNVAMMAPDVDTAVLRTMIQDILKVSKRTTLYGSSRDEALKFSAKVNGRARAGQGFPDMFCSRGMDSIDASKVDTSLLGLGHQYYGDSSTILHDLDQLFTGRPPDQRLDLRKESGNGLVYYVFE